MIKYIYIDDKQNITKYKHKILISNEVLKAINICFD